MQFYLAATYHGPLVYGQGTGFWIVASPYRPAELYAGSLPVACLANADPVDQDTARSVLGPRFAGLLRGSVALSRAS